MYTFGTTLTLPVSVITTAFMTRHFPSEEFGQLAILFASAGILTIALNMVFLQGALLLVFVHADVGVSLDWDTAERANRSERPVILTTGVAITAVMGAVVVLVIWLFSRQLAVLLMHNPHGGASVTIAGASAATGAIYRYVSNVTRFERRPSVYASAAAARPAVALALTVPLVLLGVGINSALIATTTGSLVSAALAVFISRRSYASKVSLNALKRSFRVGLPWIPVVGGLYVAHSADLLFLRSTASNSTLGIYRIADGLSSVISYAVSSFHLAQVPLEGTLTVQSAYVEHTRDRVMATYVLGYLMTSLAILLVLSIGGGLAVALIAPGYGRAAPYIPITSLAYVGYGFLLVTFRAGDYYGDRVRAYALTAGAAGVSVTVLALTLLHVIGVAGAPTGAAIGCFGTAAVLLALGHRAGHPLPLDYRRLFGTIAVAGAAWAVGTQVGHGATATIAKFCGLLMYPAGLILFRIIPGDISPLLPRMLRGIFPRRQDVSPGLLKGLAQLSCTQRDALIAVSRDGLDPATAASRLGLTESRFLEVVAEGLRRLGGGRGSFPLDQQLAYYLVTNETPADSDETLRDIRKSGANMLEFRAMERAYRALRAISPKAWNKALLAPYRLAAPANLPAPSTLGSLARQGWDVHALARSEGTTARDIRRRATGELRSIGATGPPGPADQLIGQFLLNPEEMTSSAQLWAAGVDPVELHRLDLTLRGIKSRPTRAGTSQSVPMTDAAGAEDARSPVRALASMPVRLVTAAISPLTASTADRQSRD